MLRDRKNIPVLASAFKIQCRIHTDQQPVTLTDLGLSMYLMRSVIYGWRSDDLFDKTIDRCIPTMDLHHYRKLHINTWASMVLHRLGSFDESQRALPCA